MINLLRPEIRARINISTRINEGHMQVTITAGKTRKVADYAEASRLCREFLERTGKGNSRWSGGALFNGAEQVGYVSFNGRVWAGTAREWKPGQTPLYVPPSL